MQSTNHYRLPYLQGSDTVDKLPDALRRFAEGIDNAVYELAQKLEQKGPLSLEDLKRIKRQVDSLSKDYPGISQAVYGLQELHRLRVKPMLEAWEKAGKPKDFGKSQGTTPSQLEEQLKNIDSRLEKLEASGQWGNPQNVTPATVIAWLKNSDSQRDSIDKRLVKAENKIRNLERRL
ncbi:hypothetical protein CIP107559_01887 [Corynebacterium diphtheriae]|uniref:hypothetical protein n=1 Tax=Corynebacterium diphtheriae TaxID=1717 RepID=UPI0013CA6B1C|nr:hypothetical protein CIP107559_01887 [Corynebacterium diphtheriae]